MHELRITKENFKALQRKLKNFEIVRKDLNCKIGDYIIIREVELDKNVRETGRSIIRKIKYISNNTNNVSINGILNHDYCIIGF